MKRVQARRRTAATDVWVFLVSIVILAVIVLWVRPAAAGGGVFVTADTPIELSQNGPGPLQAVDVSLLSTSITVSGQSTNLVIRFDFECQLFTTILVQTDGLPLISTGTSTSEADTGLSIWATVDGVPVLPPGNAADFKAIACDRGDVMTATLASGESVRSFHRSKTTHGFTWIAQNVGVGAHFVEVHGTLIANVTGVDGAARVTIAKRVLTVSPL